MEGDKPQEKQSLLVWAGTLFLEKSEEEKDIHLLLNYRMTMTQQNVM